MVDPLIETSARGGGEKIWKKFGEKLEKNWKNWREKNWKTREREVRVVDPLIETSARGGAACDVAPTQRAPSAGGAFRWRVLGKLEETRERKIEIKMILKSTEEELKQPETYIRELKKWKKWKIM